MKNHGHHGDDEKDVDQPPDGVERQRTNAPNQQQDKSQRHQHYGSPFGGKFLVRRHTSLKDAFAVPRRNRRDQLEILGF
jgi:hypothetical protein